MFVGIMFDVSQSDRVDRNFCMMVVSSLRACHADIARRKERDVEVGGAMVSFSLHSPAGLLGVTQEAAPLGVNFSVLFFSDLVVGRSRHEVRRPRGVDVKLSGHVGHRKGTAVRAPVTVRELQRLHPAYAARVRVPAVERAQRCALLWQRATELLLLLL